MIRSEKKAKCVVWDLDNTLWQGTLLEEDEVQLKSGVIEIIKTLDKRGILQSIASKNDFDTATDKLNELGLGEYFLYPQINWNAKSESLKQIASELNIGIDSLVFIDDQRFEREEVGFSLPEVHCIDGNDLRGILNVEILKPDYITDDSALRRRMYQSDIHRKQEESNFKGNSDAFLTSLEMKLDLFYAQEKDLQRAVELTERTNQLNSSGITFSYNELNAFSVSSNHILLMARLKDKFGTYGHIGLVLIEKEKNAWVIKLFLMSCRVMTRGIGAVILGHIINKAREKGIRLKAMFRANSKNRMMNITYRFAGFSEVQKTNDVEELEHQLCQEVKVPDYLELNSEL